MSKKLNEGALKVYEALCKHFYCDYDELGAIGRRYRRQDEIGIPFCVTFDFDSLNDGAITIRQRDSMEQVRVNIKEAAGYIARLIV